MNPLFKTSRSRRASQFYILTWEKLRDLLVKHHKAYLKKHDGVRLNSTTLHLAALEVQKEIVELLIANGGDVNAMDESGHTPLDDLVGMDSAKWNEIADLLRKHGGKTKRELEAADN